MTSPAGGRGACAQALIEIQRASRRMVDEILISHGYISFTAPFRDLCALRWMRTPNHTRSSRGWLEGALLAVVLLAGCKRDCPTCPPPQPVSDVPPASPDRVPAGTNAVQGEMRLLHDA